MKSPWFGIVFAIAVVGAGIVFLSASFSDATPTHGSGMPVSTTAAASGVDNDNGVASVASLVGGLEDRLRIQPDDGKGWLLLAKSYRHLGRLDDAREAYRKADALGHGDPVVAEQLFGLSPASAVQVKDAD